MSWIVAAGGVIFIALIVRYFKKPEQEMETVNEKQNVKSVELNTYAITISQVNGEKTTFNFTEYTYGINYYGSYFYKKYSLEDFKEELINKRIFYIKDTGIELRMEHVTKIEYVKQPLALVAETYTIHTTRVPKAKS